MEKIKLQGLILHLLQLSLAFISIQFLCTLYLYEFLSMCDPPTHPKHRSITPL